MKRSQNVDTSEEIEVVPSSGNVFADLGLPNPEERLLKSDLAIQIGRRIREMEFSQAAAAEVLGVDQPKVSALLRGRLAGFSVERLLRFLVALGCNVRIAVSRADGGEAATLVLPDGREDTERQPDTPSREAAVEERTQAVVCLSRMLRDRLSRLAEQQSTSVEGLAQEILATAATLMEAGRHLSAVAPAPSAAATPRRFAPTWRMETETPENSGDLSNVLDARPRIVAA